MVTNREAIALRRLETLELRKRGLSMAAIAAKLGVSEATISRDITKVLAAVRTESVSELRTIEAARLDDALTAAYRKLGTQHPERAIDALVRISERRAKLFGLDERHEAAETAPVGMLLTAMETRQIMEARNSDTTGGESGVG